MADVIGEIGKIGGVMEAFRDAKENAPIEPLLQQAKIAREQADRAEAILREYSALKQLLDAGVLSEEHFEAHKKRMAEELNPDNPEYALHMGLAEKIEEVFEPEKGEAAEEASKEEGEEEPEKPEVPDIPSLDLFFHDK